LSAKAESTHGNIPVDMKRDGELLTLLIPGQQDAVSWDVTFTSSAQP
jgi:hypothetical protein